LTPGRNDPCPCGSDRKFKHCCLPLLSAEDAARVRLRTVEGRVVDGLLRHIDATWAEPLIAHAWEDFWIYDDDPDDMVNTPEFDPMFVPWLVLGFVPDPHSEEVDSTWPTEPIGLAWLATTDAEVPDLDRVYIETACRSPMSVFAVERVIPGRSIDLKDVLTGRRFHVLEQGASRSLRVADLLFTRVVTIDGVSVMLGAAPFIVPPHWHIRIIDWRERELRRRVLTRQDLADFDIEIRDLYFDIAAELLDPTPPQLCNTDGDPVALTTLTYELKTPVGIAFEKLASLATVHGEDHSDEVIRDAAGAVTSASLTWMKPGNRQHKDWTNTVLGNIRLAAGSLIADVNSARRADRLKREIAKRLGRTAVLIDTKVEEPSDAIEAIAEAAPGSSPELEAIQEEMIRKHWEDWLDERVPALGNKTPRQAARTARGRERLEALLAAFDRDDADRRDGMAAHLATIRQALAL
jgi:hypothetical protein